MSDIRLGFDELRLAASRLEDVRAALIAARPGLTAATASAGHAGLAARLGRTAEDRDIGWHRLCARSEALAEACRQIAASFESTEHRLASASVEQSGEVLGSADRLHAVEDPAALGARR